MCSKLRSNKSTMLYPMWCVHIKLAHFSARRGFTACFRCWKDLFPRTKNPSALQHAKILHKKYVCLSLSIYVSIYLHTPLYIYQSLFLLLLHYNMQKSCRRKKNILYFIDLLSVSLYSLSVSFFLSLSLLGWHSRFSLLGFSQIYLTKDSLSGADRGFRLGGGEIFRNKTFNEIEEQKF